MFTWWSLHGSGASEDVLAELREELLAIADKSRVCAEADNEGNENLSQARFRNSELSASVLPTDRE